ncbi:MAG: hypothetical protein IPL52_05830 [Flavobacteriales bacterium]|nr:hypothetical protein [Flavobacteriales bacterium]
MEPTGLPRDWVSRPALDLELKQYLLLGYLQRVNARFSERKLYPYLIDLHDHLEELRRLRDTKLSLARTLGGELQGFDATSGQAVHEPLTNDRWLAVVDEVIDLAMPRLNHALQRGSQLRMELAARIQFAPVGLLPLARQEGWLLLRMGREARAYSYSVPLLRAPDPDAGALHVRTRYVSTYSVGIGRGFEQIKMDLIRDHRQLPNPAVFAFECELGLPHIETYMPLAKQMAYEVIRAQV